MLKIRSKSCCHFGRARYESAGDYTDDNFLFHVTSKLLHLAARCHLFFLTISNIKLVLKQWHLHWRPSPAISLFKPNPFDVTWNTKTSTISHLIIMALIYMTPYQFSNDMTTSSLLCQQTNSCSSKWYGNNKWHVFKLNKLLKSSAIQKNGSNMVYTTFQVL
jgi:hypothetical protein